MIARLWNGFWLTVLLVAVPVGLVATVGNPLPARDQWSSLAAEPLTQDTLFGAAAVAVWALWSVVLYVVLAAGWLRLRHAVRGLRRLPRLPLPTPMQGLTGWMLGTVAVTTQATAATGPPPAVTAASALDTAQIPTGSNLPGDERQQVAPTGVDLRDGSWLTVETARDVEAAAALVWWRRRRDHRPGKKTGDGDLTALPPSADAVRAALAGADAPPDAAIPGLVQRLPARGVGLTGPGAADAARGLLVALTIRLTAPPQVVTTTADLYALLGTQTADMFHAIAGLRVADSVPDALAAVEQSVVDCPGQPVTILTATPGDQALARRLAALLTLGAEQGVTGVIIGAWPHGHTWQVDADGTASTDPNPSPATPGRMCMLTQTVAADLLALAALGTHETPSASVTAPPVLAVGPSTGAPLRLTLLGGIAITAGGTPVTIRRTAGVQILAFLALHGEGATTGQLTAAIWPHLRPHAAAGAFYTTIGELRGDLRAATGGREVIPRDGDRYHLQTTLIDTDVGGLLAAARNAVTAATADQRQAALEQVVGRYQGELAAGRCWPWLEPIRERVRRQAVDAYLALAAAQPSRATQWWLAAARVDPVNSYLHRHAIHALARAGEHAAAAHLADEHQRRLANGPQPGSDQDV